MSKYRIIANLNRFRAPRSIGSRKVRLDRCSAWGAAAPPRRRRVRSSNLANSDKGKTPFGLDDSGTSNVNQGDSGQGRNLYAPSTPKDADNAIIGSSVGGGKRRSRSKPPHPGRGHICYVSGFAVSRASMSYICSQRQRRRASVELRRSFCNRTRVHINMEPRQWAESKSELAGGTE